MVRRFRCKKRGIAAGIKTGLGLRALAMTPLGEFITNALIVSTEEILAVTEPTEPESEDPWKDVILSVGVQLYHSMVTGSLFPPTLNLVIKIGRHLEYTIDGYHLLRAEIEPSFEGLTDVVELAPISELDTYYGTECLVAEILSPHSLHHLISEKTGVLHQQGQAFVKPNSYRRHKKIIAEMKAATGGSFQVEGVKVGEPNSCT